jgi:hypothetical protein
MEKIYFWGGTAGFTISPVAIYVFIGDSNTAKAFGIFIWFSFLMFGITGLHAEKRKRKEAKDAA